MAQALKAQPLPTPERLTTQPPRAIPRIAPDAATPPAAGSIDIAAMARQGAALNTPPPAATGTSVLRIFITLDMPRGSLQRLVDQAARTGATLVLRGLKAQSMRQTLAAVGELIETRRVSWVIDPDAFNRWDAGQSLLLTRLLAAARDGSEPVLDATLVAVGDAVGRQVERGAQFEGVDDLVQRRTALRGHRLLQQRRVVGLLHGLQDQRRVGGRIARRELRQLPEVAGVGDHGGVQLELVEGGHGMGSRR